MADPFTAKSKSKKPTKHIRHHLKRTRLVIFGVIVVGLLVTAVIWRSGNERRIRASALSQSAEAAKKGDLDLAIRHLDLLLVDSPENIPALEAKAKLLAEASRFAARWLLEAANIHDQLIRLDPNSESRLETRRKLAEFYLAYSDSVRRNATITNDQDSEVKELRYQAAVNVAQELIRIERQKNPPIKDAAAHRLLALAYMGQVPGLISRKNADDKALPDLLRNAKSEFLEALRIDPTDLIASEKLSELYLTRLSDPIAAEKTLDKMLEVMPNSVNVRISRYRAFAKAKKMDQAKAEMDAAIALTPDDVMLRLQAASDALGRRDAATARHHIDAIPANQEKEDLRVKVLRGQVEFAEQHPDQAIDQWRQGLTLVGGGDGELSWHLAFSLIRLGGPRLADALPLINQYLRLSRDDKNGKGLFLQAMYDQRMGHPTEAISKLEKVVNVIPYDFLPDAYLALGVCYESIGEVDKALSAYANAAKSAPNVSAPRRAIARIRLARSPDLAVTELERALLRLREEGLKEDASLLFDLIRIRLSQQLQFPIEQRRWEEVEGLLQRAKVVGADDSNYRNLYAEYLASSGRIDEAVKLLEASILTIDRKFYGTWLVLSNLLERQNRRAEAIKILDQGMSPEASGDHAMLRIGKAQILINDGRGQAAREVLTKDLSTLPPSELPEVYRALGTLLRNLGDREGARANYMEWSRLAPESIEPAQTLLSFAEAYGDDEAAKLGLEVLRSGRGKNDPYALVAQALELLRVDKNRATVPPEERIRQAEELVADLRMIAPALPSRALIEGLILEYRGKLKEAAVSYRKANSVGIVGPALPRLIEAYMKLKAYDQLTALEREYEDAAKRSPTVAKEFSLISLEIARKLGDKDRAEYAASKLVDSSAESVKTITAQARLLDTLGKIAEAELKLQQMVDAHSQDPSAWYALIRYRKLRRTEADVTKTIETAQTLYKGDRPELFLGQCYLFADDKARATTYYQKAKALRPEDLVTLRAYVEFCEFTGQEASVEETLRKALKIDPTASWFAKRLALRISAKPDPATWSEAWNLVTHRAPGASADSPDDRLIQATILARSPESARRIEAVNAFIALIDDLSVASPLAIDARLRLAQAMLDANRPADAWTYIAPLADDKTQITIVALSMGIEALARSGRGDEAKKRLDRYLVEFPGAPITPLLKSWVLLAQGKKAEIAPMMKAAFASAENTPEGELLGRSIVDQLVRFGENDAAYDVAKALAAHWPRDAWYLAKTQLIRKETDQVLASCRLSIDSGGTLEAREAIRQAIGGAIAQQSDPSYLKRVEELGKLAKSKSPDDFQIFVLLATVYHLQGLYQDELTSYQQALKLFPSNAEFLNNMAWTLSEGLGKYQEALARVDEVIRRVGVTGDFLDTRGVILTRLGQSKDAIADLEQSIKLKPVATTYYHLARTYYKAGNLAESQRCRDQAWSAGFEPQGLDATDRDMLTQVMGKAKP